MKQTKFTPSKDQKNKAKEKSLSKKKKQNENKNTNSKNINVILNYFEKIAKDQESSVVEKKIEETNKQNLNLTSKKGLNVVVPFEAKCKQRSPEAKQNLPHCSSPKKGCNKKN